MVIQEDGEKEERDLGQRESRGRETEKEGYARCYYARCYYPIASVSVAYWIQQVNTTFRWENFVFRQRKWNFPLVYTVAHKKWSQTRSMQDILSRYEERLYGCSFVLVQPMLLYNANNFFFRSINSPPCQEHLHQWNFAISIGLLSHVRIF